jgi:type IV secretory pathway VirJ component
MNRPRRFRGAFALSVLAGVAFALPGAADSLAVPGFGQVVWTAPAGHPSRVVVLLDGDVDPKVADFLTTGSTLVFRLDARVLLHKSMKGCAYPAGDLESLIELLEKRIGLARYIAPVVAGTGSGAALAYASVAQAQVGTFPALLTVDFGPELAAASTLCPGRGLHATRTAEGSHLAPSDNFAPLWVAVSSAGKAAAATLQFIAAMPKGRTIESEPGEATTFPARLRGAWSTIDREIAQLDAAQSAEEAKEFSGLPVLALPAAGTPKGILAIVLSGDGGWQGVDRKVMRELTTRGVAVAGLDSQRYLWNARTPAEMAADLSRIANHYQTEWSCSQVLVIGYSAGADALAVVADGLATSLDGALRLLVLMSPSQSVRLALFTDLAGAPKPPELLVAPALRKLQGKPILCLYGEGDHDSPCSKVSPPGQAVRVAGSHALGGDAAGIADRILAAATPR